MTTYERIKELCEKDGFNISNIGMVIPGLSVTKASVTGWKNGSKPRPEKLKSIAEYFGVTVEYLLKGESEAARITFFTNDSTAPVRDSIVQSTDPDELDIIRIYRMLDRRSKHEFMMMVYEYERRME